MNAAGNSNVKLPIFVKTVEHAGQTFMQVFQKSPSRESPDTVDKQALGVENSPVAGSSLCPTSPPVMESTPK